MEMDPLLDVSVLNKVEHDLDTVNRIFLAFSSAVFALGTLLNTWFLLAVMTSQSHRSKLRSQLLCNLCVLHLGVSLVKSPLMVFFSKLLLDAAYWSTMCDSLSLAIPLELVHSFLLDWLLVFTATVYLASVLGLDPAKRIGKRAVAVGKVLLNTLPWIASPALYPLLRDLFVSPDWCQNQVATRKHTYALVNLTVPTLACIVIISVACGLYCKRVSGATGKKSLWNRMLRHEGGIDNPLIYFLTVGMSAALEGAFIFCVFKLAMGDTVRMPLLAVSCAVSSSRSVLLLVPWVLLPDVRDRLRTWRPWDSPHDAGTEQLDMESSDRD